MKRKTVVVTGGAGFIGSHLSAYLLKEGHEVICVDNLLTGNLKNIQPFKKNKRYHFLEHNISKPFWTKSKVDLILHFASPASPADYLNYPIQTMKVGSLGTLNALGLAKNKKSVFLLASTSEVYGDPLIHPQREDYWGNVNPIGPRGVYDEAKRFSEALTLAYHRYHQVDTRIVRIFNTYGPQMRLNDGRAIPAFISQALRNENITVFGDGKQTRSFCYVTDLVDGIIRLSESSLNDPVNIGNPTEMTILMLAKKIIQLTKSKSKIIHEPLPVDDPRVRKPDITKAKCFLKWSPKVPLETGLIKTIQYFKTCL